MPEKYNGETWYGRVIVSEKRDPKFCASCKRTFNFNNDICGPCYFDADKPNYKRRSHSDYKALENGYSERHKIGMTSKKAGNGSR